MPPVLLLSLLLFARPALAKDAPAYQNTVEWGRLVRCWHELIDHSSGQTYSPERFQELAPDLDQVDGDIASLVSKKLISFEVGEGLRSVFHTRHRYVEERCYPTAAKSTETSVEALCGASCWIVEMQLSLLRQQNQLETPDPRLREAIAQNLTRELSFQRGFSQLEAEQARRREELAKQEQPDWAKFSLAAAKQYDDLVQAYQDHRLPRNRAVSRLLPYLLELTQATPLRKAGAAL